MKVQKLEETNLDTFLLSNTIIYHTDPTDVKLLHDICIKLNNNGYDCEYYVPNTIDAEELSKRMNDLQKEMMHRYTKMEQEQVNSFSKLKEAPSMRIICIECIDQFLADNNYKAVDILKQSLNSLMSIGRAAGIKILIVRIITGNYGSNDARNLFNEDKVLPLNEDQFAIWTFDDANN